MSKLKKVQKKKISKGISKWAIPLTRTNFYFFGLGLLILIVGFYIMTIPPWDSFFALVIAPLLLLLGYFIIFPLGILKKKQENE